MKLITIFRMKLKQENQNSIKIKIKNLQTDRNMSLEQKVKIEFDIENNYKDRFDENRGSNFYFIYLRRDFNVYNLCNSRNTFRHACYGV